MDSKYHRTASLDRFIRLLYAAAQEQLASREPDFVQAFRTAMATGEPADVAIENSKLLVKGEIPEWIGLLEKTYEVELYFVKLGYATMLLSIDPPRGLTGEQPLGPSESFQYHMDSYHHVLFGLLDRLKGLVTYLHRTFIPQVYSSCDRDLILKDQLILKEVEAQIKKNKDLVSEYRSPMAHYRSPGVEALDKEGYWYTYLGLPERLDLVEVYYLPVLKYRLRWTKMLRGLNNKVYTFVEGVFSRLITLNFLCDMNSDRH